MRYQPHLFEKWQKSGTIFYCQECGYESAKWMGQCPGCHTWNSFVEETGQKVFRKRRSRGTLPGTFLPGEASFHPVGNFHGQGRAHSYGNRRTGSGAGWRSGARFSGACGGDPGIGKSTLLLQMCRLLAESGKKVLYISGEESLQQIKMRAQRIGEFRDTLQLLCETNLGKSKGRLPGKSRRS